MVCSPWGEFMTQRKHPKMALIEPKIDLDNENFEKSILTLSAPGMPDIEVKVKIVIPLNHEPFCAINCLVY